MKTYKIPVTWREYGYVTVTADSKEAAIELAHEADLPSHNSAYLEDSFEIDHHAIICLDEVNE